MGLFFRLLICRLLLDIDAHRGSCQFRQGENPALPWREIGPFLADLRRREGNYLYERYLTGTCYKRNLKIFVIKVKRENPMRQILSLSKQLGPIIQSARKSAGLSQTELAQRLGISQSRISAMELDPGSINVEQLLALLAALNHEVLVQPKKSIGEERGSNPPEW
jgi:HTH-type transcriptional regulator/antitoxin HipB